MYNIYIFMLLCGATALAAALAVYAWRHRNVQGARVFFAFLVGVAFWGSTSIISKLSPSVAVAEIWAIRVRYVAITTTPVLLYVFILTYTGRARWLTPQRTVMLFVIPAISNLLNWLWPAAFIAGADFTREGEFLFLGESDIGPFWLVNITYSYVLMLATLYLVIQHIVRARHIFRAQAILVALGIVPPLAFNIAVNVIPTDQLPQDPTLLSFTLTAVIWAWALFRYGLLTVMPVARDAVLESMEDAVLVLGEKNHVLDLNPAAHAVIRKGPEVIGQPVREVLAEQQALVERFIDAADVHTEIELGTNGTRAIYDLRIKSLHLRSGRSIGRLVVLRDVTAQKLAEEERERLIRELDAYAHTVAHDLKNPLNSLLGYSSLLAEHEDDMDADQRRQYLGAIERGSQRMSRIINELLLLASVRNTAEVQGGPVAMGEVVAGALERLAGDITASEVSVTSPDEWPVAHGYAPWVEEIWANYLSNAIKYGGEPPVITLGADILPDGVRRFWVRDNGQGLTAEEQSHLFMEFERLRQHAETVGHGLGLSIVQRIAARLGGTVGVESAPGQGSLFYFTLPPE